MVDGELCRTQLRTCRTVKKHPGKKEIHPADGEEGGQGSGVRADDSRVKMDSAGSSPTRPPWSRGPARVSVLW